MYREGEYGWRITGARVVTNSVAVRGSVNRTIAGRCWIKSCDSKWMRDAVAEGVRHEKDMPILGLDVNDAFAHDNTFTHEDNEARKYWDDLSGKELNPRSIRKAREEEMREFTRHNGHE